MLVAPNAVAVEAQPADAAQPDVGGGAKPGPPQPRANHLRTGLEMLGFLGGGAIWYILDLKRNLADWDRLSIQQRFRLDAIRLDNNDFWVNQVGHPLAGAGYYAFARSNGHSLLVASGYSFLTSLAWEYGLEFNERTSYNDLLVTPGGGIAVGEGLFHLGRYLSSGCGASVASAASWVVGFPVALHQHMDGRTTCAGPRDVLGLTASTYHRFEASAALGALDDGSAAQFRAIALDSELVDIPSFGKPVTARRGFVDGEWTRLHVQTFGGGASGVEFGGDSALLGHYWSEHLPGETLSLLLGTGLGFGYRTVHYGTWTDRFSQLNLPGAYYRIDWRRGPWSMRLRGAVTPDFVAGNSLAYDAEESRLRGKSVLIKQAYYYGYGVSGSLEAVFAFHALQLGARVAASYIDSLEGLDRTQEELQQDEQALDTRENYRVFGRLGAGTQRGPWHPFAEAFAETLRRRSRLEQSHASRAVTAYGLRLGVTF